MGASVRVGATKKDDFIFLIKQKIPCVYVDNPDFVDSLVTSNEFVVDTTFSSTRKREKSFPSKGNDLIDINDYNSIFERKKLSKLKIISK